MMKHMIAVASMLWLVLVAGCASTKLTLNLDLYKEDPTSLVPLTAGRVVKLQKGLAAAQAEAQTLAADRRDLADNLFKTYESLFRLLTESRRRTYDPVHLNPLRQYLDSYKNAVTMIANDISNLVAEAQRKLGEYMEIADDKSQAARLAQIGALKNSASAARELVKLGGPLGTPFEDSLTNQWQSVADSITTNNVKTLIGEGKEPSPQVKELRDQVEKLASKLQELALRAGAKSKEISGSTFRSR